MIFKLANRNDWRINWWWSNELVMSDNEQCCNFILFQNPEKMKENHTAKKREEIYKMVRDKEKIQLINSSMVRYISELNWISISNLDLLLLVFFSSSSLLRVPLGYIHESIHCSISWNGSMDLWVMNPLFIFLEFVSGERRKKQNLRKKKEFIILKPKRNNKNFSLQLFSPNCDHSHQSHLTVYSCTNSYSH